MTDSHLSFGQSGEDAAVDYLLKHSYDILDRNVRTRFGEIDIVACDGDTLCFVEVKTRHSDDRGHPFEAVTPRKQWHITRAAQAYLTDGQEWPGPMRFDVIAVMEENGLPKIEHCVDAFDAVL